jgi:tetratricopeptide (TPR) repeat protein
MGKKKGNRAQSNQKRPVSGDGRSGFDQGLMRAWVIGLLLGVTFLVFSNTITNKFAYDDTTQILQNGVIQDFSNIKVALTKELWYWRVLQDDDPNKPEGPTTPYYRPLFTIFLMVFWQIFGTSAAGWHVVNIIVHLAVVYFGFLIIEKVTGDLRLSAIAMLLFAVHPLRSESVAWISGVTDPLLALFMLPSFYLYMRYREEGRLKLLVWSLALFLLAAFSKEPAIALPVFVIAYEVFVINQSRGLMERIKPAAMYSSAFFALSAAYFIMRYFALGFVLNDIKYTSYPIEHVLMTIPIVIWKYIGLLFWPVNLSIFHDTRLVDSPLSPRFIAPLVGLIALAFLLWPLRKSRVARFAILWFGIHLLPVMNLSTFGEAFMVQERYVYISSIGFSLLVAMGLMKLPVEQWLAFSKRRTAQIAVVAVILLLMAGKTVAQNSVWKDDQTLWTHGAEVAADQPMPHYVLAQHYLKLQNTEKIVESLEEFVRLYDENPYAIANLAAAHLLEFDRTHDRFHIDRAIALCEKGLSINDQNPALWDSLGRAYASETDLKNYARAHAFFERGLRAQPDNAMLNFHQGATYAKEGKNEAALRYLEQARNLEPALPDPYKFLAYIYKKQGRLKEAADHFARYLELQPNAIDAARISKELEDLRAGLNTQSPQS